MKQLRLLLFKECNRACPGCCNKDWDVDNLPKVDWDNLENYGVVMLTGGEPMIRPLRVISTAYRVREYLPNAKIFVYTAKVDTPWAYSILTVVDGYTVNTT